MMYFKWIFTIIGFAYLGARGAVAGFIFGWLIDSFINTKKPTKSAASNLNSFVRNLVILTAAVMKADGSVVKGELDYVKSFFRKQFGDDVAKQALLFLRDVLNRQLPVQQASIQIRTKLDYATRVHILHYLFGLSLTKGMVNASELNAVESIANYLGISHSDFLSVKTAFLKNTRTPSDVHWAYKVLEIQANASNDEIKKAYRRMAVKYHPDKASHLGDKEQKIAEEHFKKINNAFDEIKRQRGIV